MCFELLPLGVFWQLWFILHQFPEGSKIVRSSLLKLGNIENPVARSVFCLSPQSPPVSGQRHLGVFLIISYFIPRPWCGMCCGGEWKVALRCGGTAPLVGALRAQCKWLSVLVSRWLLPMVPGIFHDQGSRTRVRFSRQILIHSTTREVLFCPCSFGSSSASPQPRK